MTATLEVVETDAPPQELIQGTVVSAVVAHRDAAMAAVVEAAALLAQGFAKAEEARQLGVQAHAEGRFYEQDRSKQDAYQKLFTPFDAAGSVECFRQQVDANTWVRLLSLTGIDRLMDKQGRADFMAQLAGDVPIVSEENIYDMFEGMVGDARRIFQRGLARAFGSLDRRFKSHDGFKVGSRIIVDRVFDADGHVNYHSKMGETLLDIERAFAVLSGEPETVGSLMAQIREERAGSWRARQSEHQTRYFKIRIFKNGNAHLWMLDADLVDAVNRELADFYGEVLPDGVARDPDQDAERDLHSNAGLPSKDLAFYPTDGKTAAKALRLADVWIRKGDYVLEPQAGEGGLLDVLLPTGARIDAVEINAGRCQRMALKYRQPSKGGLTIIQANFLRMSAVPKYTHVVMNPPFHGTHWMEHVVHAMAFLAPGGVLTTILPISAELGETKKHKAFRAWAAKYSRYGELRFSDLPPESFKAAGTRINTVVLTLYKGR